MAAATIARADVGQTEPGFSSTLASEWTKLRSVRATYVQVLLTVALSIGFSALISLVIGSTWDDATPQQRADFDPTYISFAGTGFGFIVMTVMAVTFASSEYSSGMISLTLATTPRRGRVLAAKAIIIALVTLVLGTFVTVAAFYIGQAAFRSSDIPSASLSDGDVQKAVLAACLTTPLFPLMGTALGVILRSTAGAITGILGLIFAPAIFGALLPDWLQRNVLAYLPGIASDNLLQADPNKDSLTYLEPGVAIVAMLVWFVAFFVVAYLAITKRDV